MVDVALSAPNTWFYSVHKCNPAPLTTWSGPRIERVPEKPVFLSEPVYEGRASMRLQPGLHSGSSFRTYSRRDRIRRRWNQLRPPFRLSFNLGSDGKWGLDPSPDGLPWKDALHAIGQSVSPTSRRFENAAQPVPRTVYSAETRRDASAITE